MEGSALGFSPGLVCADLSDGQQLVLYDAAVARVEPHLAILVSTGQSCRFDLFDFVMHKDSCCSWWHGSMRSGACLCARVTADKPEYACGCRSDSTDSAIKALRNKQSCMHMASTAI